MKLSAHIRNTLHKKHPLLRLTVPFIEPTVEEMEKVYRYLDLADTLQIPLNPLERLGLDLLLSSIQINKKEDIKKLMEYLNTH